MNKIQLEVVKEGFTHTVTNVMMTANFTPPVYYKLTKALLGGVVYVDPDADTTFTLLKTETIKVYIGGHGSARTFKVTSYDDKKGLKLEQVGRESMPPCVLGNKFKNDLYFEDSEKEAPIRYRYVADDVGMSTPAILVLASGEYYRFDEETKKINLKVLENFIGHDIILYKNGLYNGLKVITKAGLNKDGVQYFEFDIKKETQDEITN